MVGAAIVYWHTDNNPLPSCVDLSKIKPLVKGGELREQEICLGKWGSERKYRECIILQLYASQSTTEVNKFLDGDGAASWNETGEKYLAKINVCCANFCAVRFMDLV